MDEKEPMRIEKKCLWIGKSLPAWKAISIYIENICTSSFVLPQKKNNTETMNSKNQIEMFCGLLFVALDTSCEHIFHIGVQLILSALDLLGLLVFFSPGHSYIYSHSFSHSIVCYIHFLHFGRCYYAVCNCSFCRRKIEHTYYIIFFVISAFVIHTNANFVISSIIFMHILHQIFIFFMFPPSYSLFLRLLRSISAVLKSCLFSVQKRQSHMLGMRRIR